MCLFYFQLLNAAQTFSQYPGSRIAEGNLDVFAKAWEGQINELSILVKEVNDVCQGKMEKQVYQSLPRPGVRIHIFIVKFLLFYKYMIQFCQLLFDSESFHIVFDMTWPHSLG